MDNKWWHPYNSAQHPDKHVAWSYGMQMSLWYNLVEIPMISDDDPWFRRLWMQIRNDKSGLANTWKISSETWEVIIGHHSITVYCFFLQRMCPPQVSKEHILPIYKLT